jgi:hypothetical protein
MSDGVVQLPGQHLPLVPHRNSEYTRTTRNMPAYNEKGSPPTRTAAIAVPVTPATNNQSRHANRWALAVRLRPRPTGRSPHQPQNRASAETADRPKGRSSTGRSVRATLTEIPVRHVPDAMTLDILAQSEEQIP